LKVEDYKDTLAKRLTEEEKAWFCSLQPAECVAFAYAVLIERLKQIDVNGDTALVRQRRSRAVLGEPALPADSLLTWGWETPDQAVAIFRRLRADHLQVTS